MYASVGFLFKSQGVLLTACFGGGLSLGRAQSMFLLWILLVLGYPCRKVDLILGVVRMTEAARTIIISHIQVEN